MDERQSIPGEELLLTAAPEAGDLSFRITHTPTGESVVTDTELARMDGEEAMGYALGSLIRKVREAEHGRHHAYLETPVKDVPIQAGDELRTAAKLMRERAGAVDSADWPGKPWAVEACGDDEAANCPCIVQQGKYALYDEPQVPQIQYVADAETPEHAEYIASMHPPVALAVAAWLESAAGCECGPFDDHGDLAAAALIVARAYLGTEQEDVTP